jgi:uncharacterized membrane protein YphA (DoxX/SURF4 family)
MTAGGEMRDLKIGGTWLLQILLALVMIGPGGITKFTSSSWACRFREWGYPEGFHLVVGALELAGGIALLIPRTASYSALMLMVVMTGAAATQIFRGGRNGAVELVFVALLGVIAAVRWRDRAGLGASRPSIAPVP